MRRERITRNRGEGEEISNRKWFSVIGFLISITLLSIAIFLSINEENNERMAKINETDNLTKIASSEISKSVNEVKKDLKLNNNEENKLDLESHNIDFKENSTNNASESISENIKANADAININEQSTENKPTSTNQQYSKSKQVSTQQNDNGDNNDEKQNEVNKTEKNDNNTKNEPKYINPVEGAVIREYSMDSLIYSNTLQEWITHKGIDIKSDQATPVKAVATGKVQAVKNDPRYGQSITIEHEDGFKTIYACLLSTEVSEGDVVGQGQQIGLIGNSGVFEVADGPHLHFEMLKNDEYVNPAIYIK